MDFHSPTQFARLDKQWDSREVKGRFRRQPRNRYRDRSAYEIFRSKNRSIAFLVDSYLVLMPTGEPWITMGNRWRKRDLCPSQLVLIESHTFFFFSPAFLFFSYLSICIYLVYCLVIVDVRLTSVRACWICNGDGSWQTALNSSVVSFQDFQSADWYHAMNYFTLKST